MVYRFSGMGRRAPLRSTAVCFFNKRPWASGASYDLAQLTRDDYVAAKPFGGEIRYIVGEGNADGSKVKVRIPKDGVVVLIFK